MTWNKKSKYPRIGGVILGLILSALVILGAYLFPKYGFVGSYYAVQYQLEHLAEQFSPQKTVSAGSRPALQSLGSYEYIVIDESIAGDIKLVGDIDGDGYPDLLIGGMPQEQLNWYRYPNWKKTVIATPVNEFTTDGALGDVDGDGDLDIIVPDGDSGDNLVWFENPRPNGNPANGGEWIRHSIGAIGGWGKDVKPADYDGDGRLDIATRSENNVMIFFQTANDVWSKVAFSDVNSGREGMASGDIDSDGHTDLVLQGVWLRNPGAAAARTSTNWTQFTIGEANPDFKALVVDLNQDGVMDVLFSSSENTADVDWWTPTSRDPTGVWTRHTIVPAMERVHTLQAADMDGDGDIDVVLGQMHTSAAGEIMVMNNLDGQGTSWTKEVVGAGGIHNGVVADIGNDGAYDIFGANWTGNPPVKLWINHGASSAWVYKEITAAHQQTFGLAFGDVDGDDNTDILSGRYWYRNPGGDLMGDWQQSPFPPDMQALLFVDVNGNNLADVIAHKDEGDIALYWLEATNPAASDWNAIKIGTVPQASHSLGAQGYRSAQIEMGGKAEILISSGQGIFYFRIPDNPNAGNWPRVHVSANPSDEGFAVGDIDRDGRLDIAATTGDSKRVDWYQNPGDGSDNWAAFPIGDFAEAVYPDRTELADLNGDGRLDIIVSEENGEGSGAETFWWEQPANPQSANWPRRLIASQATTNSMDVGDIDSDGDIDILLGEHRGEKNLTLWLNDGQGNFSGSILSSGYESHLGARLVDLTGNNRLEIVSIAWDNSQHIHLWHYSLNLQPNKFLLPQAQATEQPTLSARPTSVIKMGDGKRLKEGLQVFYTFKEGGGAQVGDKSEVGEPLNLVIANPDHVSWLEDGGLEIRQPTLIRSDGPAAKVIAAVKNSAEISLEAWVKPANSEQNGPVRLIGISVDPFNRNFTLGQEADLYEIRLRTTGTSENGTPALTSSSGSASTGLTHIFYTRSANGQTKVFIDGIENSSGMAEGDFSSWDDSYSLLLADELTRERPWLGEYYLLAIYNRAFTPAEIEQNFQAGLKEEIEEQVIPPAAEEAEPTAETVKPPIPTEKIAATQPAPTMETGPGQSNRGIGLDIGFMVLALVLGIAILWFVKRKP